jgi:membrane protease YdiL (CAAX protease family)
VEVLALAVGTIVIVFVSMLLVSWGVHHLLAPRTPWGDIARRPEVVVFSQVVAYCVVLVMMYWLAGARGGRPKDTLRWNWPRHAAIFLWYGIALSIGLQLFAHLLPMPKTLPIDQFFETRQEAWLLSIFGITLAPLIEELFFRGFLYPVLARRLNVATAIVLTGLAFGAIHGAQLMYSWGPVLVIVIVGIVLTAVRAYTNSVGSTVLMHIGYNLTITVAMYYSTDGFHHLEKLKQ